jgi:hypothetical protein
MTFRHREKPKKNMNKRLLLLVLSMLLLTTGALAQSKSKQTKMTAEQLAKAVSKAFKEKRLGRLDASHPYLKTVQIITEDTLGEGPERHTEIVKTMKQAERMFRASNLNTGPLIECEKGTCTYNVQAGLHNNLYLQSITYGYRKGSAYLKTILILDGN